MVANPFDVLPLNLFNLFSTQGYTSLQRHYMAILLQLYALAEFNRFGLTREIVIAEIVDYLKTTGAEAEVAAAMEADVTGEPELGPASLTGQKMAHEYAAFLLRRLAETGWVEREQHADYSETIILPDYAFTLLEALRAIQEQKPREFTGQLYTAHQLLTSSRGKDFSPALALTQAYENVRQVARGLAELNQNIRRYIERATKGCDVAELLRLQFDDYAQTLGPAYHALKTSDHVSRYRRDIVGKLQTWGRSAEWLDRAAEELAAQGRFTPAQAGQEIGKAIEFIVNQLEGLDPLLEEIDRRHAQYLRTSLRQIRYQLVSADGSFKDRLVSLARGLASLQGEGDTHLPDGAPGWQLHPVDSPDLHSFYTPPRRRAPFTPAAIGSPALLPCELAALRSATLQDVTQALTPDKVNRYVLGFFNGHRALHITELPAEVVGDLHRLTTIIAYADHPEVKYGIELADGDPVEIGLYRVVPFRLEKL
ncbi:MAG: DUF5716 family protein [Verrucomicrobiales bacterium]|nr:DUF5716 family protein [Verrucomicrobiales bacterium]